jgi:enoyl-CoA hydratase/carnithine racemase
MKSEAVKSERAVGGPWVEVTLPGGTLSMAAARQLTAIAESLAEDRSVRAVLLTSQGPDFCLGAAQDLDVTALATDPAAAVARLRVPVVVDVRGVCSSVGLEIALACDLRIVGPDSVFDFPELAQGRLPSWGGLPRAVRSFGRDLAVQMVLLGTSVDADTAHRVGMAHQVTTDQNLARGIVKTLVSQAPLATELAKEAVHRGADLSFSEALRLEADLNHLLATTQDRAEGLRAFFDRRPADFTGR